MNFNIHIKENNISIGQYVLYTLSAYMKARWWAYALPVCLCLVLSFKNINFLFVAIILMFLVFTLIQFMVVIYYGLVPESRYSTLPKEIYLNKEGILLELKKKVYNDVEFSEEDSKDDETPDFVIEKQIIAWDRIDGIIAKDDCLLLAFKRPRYSFLAIPYKSFINETHLRDAVSFIRSNLG